MPRHCQGAKTMPRQCRDNAKTMPRCRDNAEVPRQRRDMPRDKTNEILLKKETTKNRTNNYQKWKLLKMELLKKETYLKRKYNNRKSLHGVRLEEQAMGTGTGRFTGPDAEDMTEARTGGTGVSEGPDLTEQET